MQELLNSEEGLADEAAENVNLAEKLSSSEATVANLQMKLTQVATNLSQAEASHAQAVADYQKTHARAVELEESLEQANVARETSQQKIVELEKQQLKIIEDAKSQIRYLEAKCEAFSAQFSQVTLSLRRPCLHLISLSRWLRTVVKHYVPNSRRKQTGSEISNRCFFC